jgi:hypothetical protein
LTARAKPLWSAAEQAFLDGVALLAWNAAAFNLKDREAWMRWCGNRRQATLRGFYDAMSAGSARKALSSVTVSKPSWLRR